MNFSRDYCSANPVFYKNFNAETVSIESQRELIKERDYHEQILAIKSCMCIKFFISV